MSMKTLKQWADLLNGRQYREEISQEEELEAYKDGIVIVFGASDDLTELRGAIEDELDTEITYFDRSGQLLHPCEDECFYWNVAKENAQSIEPIFDSEGYTFIYKTDIPHETFEIMQGEEKYCRGIVFEMKDVIKE